MDNNDDDALPKPAVQDNFYDLGTEASNCLTISTGEQTNLELSAWQHFRRTDFWASLLPKNSNRKKFNKILTWLLVSVVITLLIIIIALAHRISITRKLGIDINCDRIPNTIAELAPIVFHLDDRKLDDSFKPIDCEEILRQNPSSTSGVYSIYPPQSTISDNHSVPVYCDMTLGGGGWTAFQRRIDGYSDFYVDWGAYKYGFGNANHNYWLGNEYIFRLTGTPQLDVHDHYGLLVYMTTQSGVAVKAYYENFYIESEANEYKLRIGRFVCGNGRDSMIDQSSGSDNNNGRPFTTKDRSQGLQCPMTLQGGWWYYQCSRANLNGVYGNKDHGLFWYSWNSTKESMATTAMMIRKLPFKC